MRLAQRTQDPVDLALAHHLLGETLYYAGDLTPARQHLEQAIAVYGRRLSDQSWLWVDVGVVARGFASVTLFELGYPDQALQRSHETVALAQELSHPPSLVFAQYFAVKVHTLRQEWRSTQERAEAMIALCTEQGAFLQFKAWATTERDWALTAQGQLDECMAQMRQGLTAIRALGNRLWQPRHLVLLAHACAQAGHVEEALALVAEGLDIVHDAGSHLSESSLYKVNGECHLALSGEHEVEAEACFRQAIDIARRQSAKSLELRAATSLARLWQQQEKRAEAHQLLSDIYNWFTEGFDTADLKDAKALLVAWG